MSESEKPSYSCSHCPYKSKHRHNVTRHIRAVHPELASKPTPALPSPPPPTEDAPPPVPPPSEEPSDDMSYNDLEDLIDSKVESILKQQNIVVSPQVRKSVMKQFMSSSTASIFAGVCIGYLLTVNAPLLVGVVRRLFSNFQSPSGQQGGGATAVKVPVMTQEELMRQVMLRQPVQPPVTAVSSQPSEGKQEAS